MMMKSAEIHRHSGSSGRHARGDRVLLRAGLGVVAGWVILATCATGCRQGGGGPLLDAQGEEEIWTIRCTAVRGPDRQRIADGYGVMLRKVAGLKPELVHVHHDAQESVVYYGKFRREYDALGNVERYQPDHLPVLRQIRELSIAGQDVWPFLSATMDVVPTLKPANPEWDLGAVDRADAYWTLHVAVFYNNEQLRTRRAAAEEYCRLLRQEGDEAYYHHGSSNSSVYVGLFPRGAIRTIKQEDPLTGVPSFTRRIVDERMLRLQAKYPVSLHNGHQMNELIRDPQTGTVTQRVPVPSFPVIVPSAEAREERGDWSPAAPRRRER